MIMLEQLPGGPEPAEPLPTLGTTPDPPEVPPRPGPLRDPSTELDVTGPDLGMPDVPGQEPNIPGGTMMA